MNKKTGMLFGFVVIVLASLTVSSVAVAATPFNRKYSDIVAYLKELEDRNPVNAKVLDLGVNNSGQMIKVLRTGFGPVHNLIVATHHGNEYGSTEVGLAMAASLAEKPIEGQTVYVIPVLNIPGYDKRSRHELGHDPNRDYEGPCGTDGPWNLKSTRALAQFLEKENIVTSATLHTYSPFVLYPWGFSTHDTHTEYDQLYIDLAKAATIESKYPVGNSTEELYPADGTYEDYAFWKHGVWSLLFELGFSHSPNQNAVDELVRVNVPGIRRYLELAPKERAPDFAFKGKCDRTLNVLDRRDE